ncbi:MAG: DsrE family protein [Anaerolineaceae bacterium]
MKKYQVVFHLDEEAETKVNFVLNNLVNLLIDLGEENVDIELLANGPAVKAFQKSNGELAGRVRQLADQNVVFAMCNNALKLFDLSSESLVEEAVVVPAGVSELVKKQSEGWAYIRP